MAKKKIIHAPRTYKITYRNDNGEPVDINIALNRDYEIRSVDGTKRYVTIRNITLDKANNNAPIIEYDLEIHPGFMNVLTVSQDRIAIDDVREITVVHAKYARSKRSYKKDTENSEDKPKTESFTFEFKSFYYNRPYRIIAYVDEFIALITSGPNGTRINNYGCIEDVTDTEIIFTSYTARWGNRTIHRGVRIPISDLIGIYRFSMEIEPFNPKDRSDDEKKDAESSDEATILSIE